MKKMNKKGFTITELVIVIAVIAILAGVMIPTFGGIIEKANQSNAQSAATALYKEAYALDLSDGELDGKDNGADITKADGKVITYTSKDSFSYNDGKYTCSFDGSKWTVTKNP